MDAWEASGQNLAPVTGANYRDNFGKLYWQQERVETVSEAEMGEGDGLSAGAVEGGDAGVMSSHLPDERARVGLVAFVATISRRLAYDLRPPLLDM